MKTLTILLPIVALWACSPANDTDPVDDTDTDVDPGVTDPDFVTVGVFSLESDGSYTDLGREITFEVGVTCFAWNRSAMAHGEYTDSHQHYNTSDGNTYVDGTFTWTEYGPKHEEEEADSACASGEGGTDKWANWTDYFEEQHGDQDSYYLQIIDAY